MIPGFICHWMAKRACKHHIAERFEQNYLQFMRQPEGTFDEEIFIQNLQQRLRLMVTLRSLPPQSWLRVMSPVGRDEINKWATEYLYQQRTLVPLLRWNGLPLVLASLIQSAPEAMDFLFISQDPLYRRLATLRRCRDNSLLSHRPLAVFVFIDERLPESPLMPFLLNGNRLRVTAVFPHTLTRLHMEIQTLIPVGMPDTPSFRVIGQRYAPDAWEDAVAANFQQLCRFPTYWGQWDDISVLLHG
ncbi:hypothetical protein [Erwinia persicina]|uniref:Uncharacterized protein n=1 Tax=Erwinia persicina TaxID=55211 RepID=A0A4U3F9Q6_9GAMM|nr:hypothetical protein [Erwinia persicina]MBD8107709.1 hypothetical protein [Erwinia persicina]MBD8168725.1 hypothetical protein [Erwinia persicina]MBD8210789.1 hypothetical protein [Erwinia persicina]MCQ4106843.1 hypothetical protein [Erwinia persicina]QZQ50407.1 hypothetical protein K6L24_00875 [Erwinia persicina]